MKILIVDDEALALSRLKRMLNTLGYDDIIEVDSATGALEAIKENHFDLALLDINMPGSSGLELGYELRYHQEDIAIMNSHIGNVSGIVILVKTNFVDGL